MCETRTTRDEKKAEEGKRKDDFYEKKSLSYYQASLTTWLNLRSEKIKYLLSFSALAIGWILTQLPKSSTSSMAYSLTLSALLFVIVIMLCLYLYNLGADYIKKIILEKALEHEEHFNSDDKTKEELEKAKLDTKTIDKKIYTISIWSNILFISGIVLMIYAFVNYTLTIKLSIALRTQDINQSLTIEK